MSAHEDGGPAFPSSIAVGSAGDVYRSWTEGYGGMTLRDWFAGQALAGLLASPNWGPVDGRAAEERYAMSAYLQADAMLVERERTA